MWQSDSQLALVLCPVTIQSIDEMMKTKFIIKYAGPRNKWQNYINVEDLTFQVSYKCLQIPIQVKKKQKVSCNADSREISSSPDHFEGSLGLPCKCKRLGVPVRPIFPWV